MQFRGVFVDIIVFPAISKVAFKIVKTNKSTLVNEAEPLRRLTFMLVYFRRTFIEIIFLMIDGMVERQFDKIKFRKHFFHFSPDIVIQTEIIRNMQKAAAEQIA